MQHCILHNSPTQSFSLVDLVGRIAENSDHEARDVFLLGRYFHTQDKPELRLAEYVDTLRIRASGRICPTGNGFETADKAYDITIDKFSHLPAVSEPCRKPLSANQQKVKREGPDCRKYFKAFKERLERKFREKPPKGQLDEERQASAALQRFIRRHFYLSLRDAERSANTFWSRYNWKLGNHSLCLWLPKSFKGAERLHWLEKNVKDPDPTRPGERERIQGIIGRRLLSMAFVPFQDDIGIDPTESIIEEISGEKRFELSLVRYIAMEKCAEINNQRRSIRRLGKDALRALILRIFEDLDAGTFQDNRIAKDFGLSKATFSRFAGSRWQSSETTTIPDLWLNTAQVLAGRPEFKEAAIKTGVWPQVEKTLNTANRN